MKMNQNLMVFILEIICAIFNSKKSKFINQQEAKGLLGKLGINTPLSKIPILGDILF